jgi:alkaline phosphatase D
MKVISTARRWAVRWTLGALLMVGAAHAVSAGAVAEGPMIGAVTPTTAQVWARWGSEGTARVVYRSLGGGEPQHGESIAITAASDYTGTFRLPDLSPNTRYRYRLKFRTASGEVSESPDAHFRTAKLTPKAVTIAVLADFVPQQKASAALVAATSPRPDAVLVIGDMDHSDPAKMPGTKEYYPPEDAPIVLANMRAMRREMRNPATPLGAQFQQAFVASASADQPQVPLYNVWDDHDYCMNNADRSCPFADLARQVYTEYFMPAADNGLAKASECPIPGVWQSFSYGSLAEFFMLDGRSNLDALSETMLGACQRQWLMDRLSASTATWKFIVSPVTFNPLTKPWDAWSAYPDERALILDFIRNARIPHVVVISADIHSGGAIDDGSNSGLPEVSVPHANMPLGWVNTYCRLEPGDPGLLTSTPGSWTIGSLTDANIGGDRVTCLGRDYSGKRTSPLPPPPYPLDGTNGAGYLSIELTPTSATLSVMSSSGTLKSGYRSDGSPTDLKLELSL